MNNLNNYFKIDEFARKYKYEFENPHLLCEALTHTSFANEYVQKTGRTISHNERLEFLGDSVMGTIISTYIFKRFPDIPEGKLSKMRSAVVCEASLAECFIKNGLVEFFVIGKGEELTGGRTRPSILADCFEAIIGAIYLDGGMNAAENYINEVMLKFVEHRINSYDISDAKTYLQESIRKIGAYTPIYEVIKSEGPDHNKLFTVRVKIEATETCNNPLIELINSVGEGEGSSKKEAEQRAALDLLNKVDL